MSKYALLGAIVLCLGLVAIPALAQQDALNIALQYVDQNARQLGLTATDVDDIVVTDQYVSQHNGVTHIYLQQRHAGIPVFNGLINVSITRDGQVLHVGNRFVRGLAQKVTSTTAALSATAAVEAAASHLDLTITESLTVLQSSQGAEQETLLSDGAISKDAIPAQLVYQPLENGDVVLAWDVVIDPVNDDHWWQMRVDASSGAELDRTDWVSHDDFGPRTDVQQKHTPTIEQLFAPTQNLLRNPDSYLVYPLPSESPQHPFPGGTAQSIVVNPADFTASPFGWHDTNGLAGAEFTITRGNNVHAYEDRDGNDTPPNPSNEPNGGAELEFDFPINLANEPDTYTPGATVNLFYWNNIIHDIMYQYGFDEAGGNFQQINYTPNGAGGDYVQAQSQARADQAPTNQTRCNANFGTSPDGIRPRMRMYVCQNTSPLRDGDMDNGVIIHEYGHGISNRLTGGPSNTSCLSGEEQMGEGWSDWYGLMLTQQAGELGPNARGIGTYLFGQAGNGGGIRARPYSTDFAVNDFTYDNIMTAALPHGVGHVWATMLWDLNWALIGGDPNFPNLPAGDDGNGGGSGFDADIYNGTGGNNLAIQLVTDGMKLQPCGPGFVDGRDAILAADVALTGGANECTIWGTFARRGLGFSAIQGGSGSRSDGTEAFDLPPACMDLTINKTGDPLIVPDDTVLEYTLSVAAANNTQTNVIITDPVPEFTTYVPGSASDGGSEAGGIVSFPATTINPGDMITRTFEVLVNTGVGAGDLLFEDDMEGGSGNWNVAHGSGALDWALSGTNPNSGSSAWFAADPEGVTDQYLILASSVLLNDFSTLRFWHEYDTEATWDGGVVEISTNSGASWVDLGAFMIQNGYNSTIEVNPASPISGREAFSGVSGGYIETIVDLSSFTGENAVIRFRLASDEFSGADGWYVDDVRIDTEAFIMNEACVSSTETPIVCDATLTSVIALSALFVATTGDDTGNDCRNPVTPCATVGRAVDQANPGETINVAPGEYVEPGLVIDKAVNIIGAGVIMH